MVRKAAFLLFLALGVPSALPGPAWAQVQQAAVPSNYRINPGDDLEVVVWGEERLAKEVRVLPDGTFVFPLAGQIIAANRLPSDVAASITQGLRSQYRGSVPQVTVSVRNPAGMQFSVIGKVRSPGTFTPGRYVNALEALSFAGGPTEFAQLSNVIIIRKAGAGWTTFRVRLNDLLKGDISPRALSAGGIPQIQGGDTVVVP